MFAATFDDYVALAGSFGVHLLAVLLLFMVVPSAEQRRLPPERMIIRAELVSLDSLSKPEPAPQQRVIDLTRQQAPPPPPAVERLQVPQTPPETPPAPRPVQERPPEIDLAAARREAERLAELQRQQLELQQRQNDMAAQLDAELDAVQAEGESQVVMSYAAWIAERVESNWSRPPSARTGMTVRLRVNMMPTGRVVSVEVIESSGDDAFDRSAMQAVRRAEPYSRLSEIDPELFEQQFRLFSFLFNPRDLRL